MKSKLLLIIAIIGLNAQLTSAQVDLAQKLSGRILLQVESRGEAWYVNPVDQKRYFLDRPIDAFNLMRRLSLGITNVDINKIPVGFLDYAGVDTDGDGLNDNLEQALGTDPVQADTDSDGFNDKIEIINKHDPLSQGQLSIDDSLIRRLEGKIMLQVEGSGAAWYLNPTDQKRYYLGRPINAWEIMRALALGITDKNLGQITIGQLQPTVIINPTPSVMPTPTPAPQTSVLDQAASSIRNNDSTTAQTFFIETMRKSIEYSVIHLSSESRLLLANLLSGAQLTSSTETEKIYSNTAYFSLGGKEVPLTFRVQKQPDGTWLIANL